MPKFQICLSLQLQKNLLENFLEAAMIRKIYKNQRTFTQLVIIHPKTAFLQACMPKWL
jgi:hypothetical protein